MTDTTSTRPQMGDEELRNSLFEIIADEHERAFAEFPQTAMQAKHFRQGHGLVPMTVVVAAMSRVRASLPQPPAQSTVHDEGHPHLIGGEFQSDKYPTTPRGKVPLSVKDPTAQDLLWTYAQRRRVVDGEFANDLELALTKNGFVRY